MKAMIIIRFWFLSWITVNSLRILSSKHTLLPINKWSRHSVCSSNNLDLKQQDLAAWNIINKEYDRQFNSLELIASENFVSSAVMDALGSCMTNKYSEGQPGNRYYGGNQYIDEMELLCKQRALELFQLNSSEWGVNVQSYSGTPANFAVYTALLNPHDRIMGLDLPSGGHLSHGYQTNRRKVSATSLYFESIPYTIDSKTGLIDYKKLQELVTIIQPKLLIVGSSAYSRDYNYTLFRNIANTVNAYLLADISHIAGFIATKQMNNPFPYCDIITTTTHKSLRGPRSALIYSKTDLQNRIDQAVFPGLQGGPHNHQIAAVAVALKEALHPNFTTYIQQVQENAVSLAQYMQEYDYNIVTNGTSNHIILWNLQNIHISAIKLEKILEKVDISINKNMLINDLSALNPGGVRIGTLALTTRGMKINEMKLIANFLYRIVEIAKKIENYEENLIKIEKKDCNIRENNNSTSSITSKKLKDFLLLMDIPPFVQQLAQIKNEVNALASSFMIPGHKI